MIKLMIYQEAAAIRVENGKAYIPFSADDLIWLADQFSQHDEYRQVIWAVIKRMEDEQQL